MDYKRVGFLPTIIKSDCCESEELISLTTHGNDQLSTGQMTIEISKAIPKFSDLQTKESGSNHEEQNFKGRSNIQLEHQEDPPYPYEYVVSNYDEEQGEIFPNPFHDPIADTSIQESSSLSLEFYHDVPIFDKYSDEEEGFKVCEDLSTYGISSSPTFFREMIINVCILWLMIVMNLQIKNPIRGNSGSKMGLIRKCANNQFCELEFKNQQNFNKMSQP